MDNLVGNKLGRYEIIEILGQGGMGIVYRALDPNLDRTVAVKVMQSRFLDQDGLQSRFRQEATTIAKLDHPSIIKVFDYDETDGNFYIVMEFISGGDLQSIIEKYRQEKRWFSLNDALGFMRQTCLALGHAHQQAVLHRDIKPSNIMLKMGDDETQYGDLGQPVIMDFGLAKLRDGGIATMPHESIGGTPAYMSPEHVQAEELDERSDLYSLGIMLYEMAVGRRPFPIKNHFDALRYHVREAPPLPRSIVPELNPALEQVILKSMAKAPEDRYQSAREFAQALTDVLAGGVLADPKATFTLMSADAETNTLVWHPDGHPEKPIPVPESQPVTQYQIEVERPDGTTYPMVMTEVAMTIGWFDDEDPAIDPDDGLDNRIRINRRADGYEVVKQSGSCDVTMGINQIPTNVAEPWPADRAIQINKYRLRIVEVDGPQGQAEDGDNESNLESPESLAPASVKVPPEVPVQAPVVAPVIHPIQPAPDEIIPPLIRIPSFSSQSSWKLSQLTYVSISVLLLLIVGLWMVVPRLRNQSAGSTETIAAATSANDRAGDSVGNQNDTIPAATQIATSTPVPTRTKRSLPTSTSAASLPTKQKTTQVPNLVVATSAPTAYIKVSNAQGLNARAGPSTAHPIVATLEDSEKISLIGRNNVGDWLQICCLDNNEAWVFAELVQQVNADGLPVAIDIPTAVAYIAKGEELEILQPADASAHSGDVVFVWEVINKTQLIEAVLNPNTNYFFEVFLINENGDKLGMVGETKSIEAIVNMERLRGDPHRIRSGQSYQWSIRVIRKSGDTFEDLGIVAPTYSIAYHGG